ncbi:pentapeptide repeat-containing protein [Actinocorallia longicatena]|uniref:pentapeptide repeat-containing protein n=1 Tax=Actinocorallia longicatena TaxID=111803 RepID=UPI003CD09F52
MVGRQAERARRVAGGQLGRRSGLLELAQPVDRALVALPLGLARGGRGGRAAGTVQGSGTVPGLGGAAGNRRLGGRGLRRSLRHPVGAALHDAVLRGAGLSGVVLRGVVLRGADLPGAALRSVALRGAVLLRHGRAVVQALRTLEARQREHRDQGEPDADALEAELQRVGGPRLAVQERRRDEQLELADHIDRDADHDQAALLEGDLEQPDAEPAGDQEDPDVGAGQDGVGPVGQQRGDAEAERLARSQQDAGADAVRDARQRASVPAVGLAVLHAEQPDGHRHGGNEHRGELPQRRIPQRARRFDGDLEPVRGDQAGRDGQRDHREDRQGDRPPLARAQPLPEDRGGDEQQRRQRQQIGDEQQRYRGVPDRQIGHAGAGHQHHEADQPRRRRQQLARRLQRVAGRQPGEPGSGDLEQDERD